jgi:uncharacterized hydrophobic protein (TIGR00341 family)
MKVIEIIVDADAVGSIVASAVERGAVDHWLGAMGENGRQAVRLLVDPEHLQNVLDGFQGLLSAEDASVRLLVYPLEVSLPRPAEEHEEPKARRSAMATREQLYNDVEKGARLDSNFLLLVLLSTIVAAIGLLENNAAVVIGAMVIAPLLGPNIALALATALGDTTLMWRALKTNMAGLLLALGVSIAIALLWPFDMHSHELLARTDVGLDGVALALASGAAAVLSLTTGLSAVLVGVMVAVALLPPTAALGLMLGSGHWSLAGGAGLLLAVNVVCVNLAAKVVFLVKGVKPRTWLEQRQARQSTKLYIIVWLLSLALLMAIIFVRQGLR